MPVRVRPPARLPPPPRGLPRRLRTRYLLVAAVVSALVALTAPMCPVTDRVGRPAWRVEMVNDGDTVTCLDGQGRQVRIRLVGIDAPELDQPHGRDARAALGRKLAGGVVHVAGAAHDQHGRLLGTLLLDDRDLNREMVADGWAWAFTGFVDDDGLVAAEAAARRARKGLWTDPEPTRPADWRRLHPPHTTPRQP
ncbi:MAG: thermonuclease family protein [Pirellulales bacterium]